MNYPFIERLFLVLGYFIICYGGGHLWLYFDNRKRRKLKKEIAFIKAKIEKILNNK